MFFALGHMIRLAVWAWPAWVAAVIWWESGQAALGSDYHDTVQVAAVGSLFVPAFLFAASGRVSPWLAILAALSAAAAGAYGLNQEYERLWPYFAAADYSVIYLLTYLDYPLVIVSLLALLGPACFVWQRQLVHAAGSGETHGSARWMQMQEAKRIFASGDLVLGEAYEPKRQAWRGGKAPLLRFDGSSHLLTVAGSNSGKTTSVAVPNCLNWQGSLVVHDPKGELARDCAPGRRASGRDVFVLDPLNSQSDGLNVLGWLDPASEQLIGDARTVVSWLGGGEDPKGDNAYFEERGRELLLLMILMVVCSPALTPEQKTLAAVDHYLSGISREWLADSAKTMGSLAFGEVSKIAQSFASIEGKSFSDFVSHAQTLLSPLKGPAVSRLVCGHGSGRTLRLEDVTLGNIDVFICVPLQMLDANPAVARLLLGTLLNCVYEHGRLHPGGKRTLFLLDEMPRLRHMLLLETARDGGRGFGVTLWAIIQDLGQLERYYGSAGVISWFENSHVKTFFGISEFSTAERLSKTLGNETVSGRSQSRKGPFDLWSGRTDAPHGRPLLTPDEIMRMQVDRAGLPDEQIVLLRSHPPLCCGLAKFYRRPEMMAQIGANRC